MDTSACKSLKDVFGAGGEIISVRTPGRVNLIGEHVDYQGGRVMPFAIDRFIYAAGRKRKDRLIKIFSADYGQKVETSLDSISKEAEKTWSNYVLGVIKELMEQGLVNMGADIAFSGNIPAGSGLSSSAAIEISAAILMQTLSGRFLLPLETVKLARRAENRFVGVECGIMDQFSVFLAKKGHAMMIDCKTLEYQYVPLSLGNLSILLVNTMKERKLSSSEYNERVASANRALEMIKESEDIEWLADLTEDRLGLYRKKIPPEIFTRALHIVKENERVEEASRLLRKGEMAGFGRLMYKSHESLRDLYGVSCDELDFIVEFSKSFPGARGARLTGAGMGGCCIILLDKPSEGAYEDKLAEGYSSRFGIMPSFYRVEPVDGTYYMA